MLYFILFVTVLILIIYFLKGHWLRYISIRLLWVVGVSFLLYMAVIISLDLYTNHGAHVIVPPLYNLTVEEAEVVLQEYNLRMYVYDTAYSEKMKDGRILTQLPDSNETVKPKRQIYVTVASNKVPIIKAPDLTNIGLRTAKIKIQQSKLRLGEIEYCEGFKDFVYIQKWAGDTLRPGTPLPAFSKITLVVGQ